MEKNTLYIHVSVRPNICVSICPNICMSICVYMYVVGCVFNQSLDSSSFAIPDGGKDEPQFKICDASKNSGV